MESAEEFSGIASSTLSVVHVAEKSGSGKKVRVIDAPLDAGQDYRQASMQ